LLHAHSTQVNPSLLFGIVREPGGFPFVPLGWLLLPLWCTAAAWAFVLARNSGRSDSVLSVSAAVAVCAFAAMVAVAVFDMAAPASVLWSLRNWLDRSRFGASAISWLMALGLVSSLITAGIACAGTGVRTQEIAS
jgi:hypothetical protein